MNADALPPLVHDAPGDPVMNPMHGYWIYLVPNGKFYTTGGKEKVHVYGSCGSLSRSKIEMPVCQHCLNRVGRQGFMSADGMVHIAPP